MDRIDAHLVLEDLKAKFKDIRVDANFMELVTQCFMKFPFSAKRKIVPFQPPDAIQFFVFSTEAGVIRDITVGFIPLVELVTKFREETDLVEAHIKAGCTTVLLTHTPLIDGKPAKVYVQALSLY